LAIIIAFITVDSAVAGAWDAAVELL